MNLVHVYKEKPAAQAESMTPKARSGDGNWLGGWLKGLKY
jgi:hypothetical protein